MSGRLLGLALAIAASAAILVAPAGASAGSFGSAMLRELNHVRGRYHLPAVRLDRRMSGTATGHSRDMERRSYFAHGDWADRVARAAGRAHSIGEVLGWLDQRSPRGEASQLVREWLGSPVHRHVLLDGAFRRIGIGRATGWFAGQQAALYTVDFATAH